MRSPLASACVRGIQLIIAKDPLRRLTDVRVGTAGTVDKTLYIAMRLKNLFGEDFNLAVWQINRPTARLNINRDIVHNVPAVMSTKLKSTNFLCCWLKPIHQI